MKIKKIKILFPIFFFAILLIPTVPSNAAIPPPISISPPREEVLWATGAGTPPVTFNPWLSDPEPWAPLMFETLYGFNTKTNEFIPVIGLGDPSTSWNVAGDILTIDLNPNAKWSNGDKVNASDVVMSYKLAEQQAKFGAELITRFSDYIAIDADTVEFHLYPNASFSKMALNFLSRDVPIIMWEDGFMDYTGGELKSLDADSLDWLSGTFPDYMKVCSGPYAPVYRNAQLTESIYQRRDDWWGNTSTYSLYPDLPNWNKGGHPKYVGHRLLFLSEQKDEAFINGDVDLHSGSLPEIWKIWEIPINEFSTHIQSYYRQEPPYFLSLGATICVGFNQMHENQPDHIAGDNILKEIWFREAMARAIKYNAIPMPASSGYWKRAMPGFLDDVAHSYFHNESITAQYQRNYDVATADAIMTANGCTRDVVTGWWEFANGSRVDGGDDGDAWTMICPIGWTDVEIFTKMVCADFTMWGIEVTIELVDASGAAGWAEWNRRIIDKEYDLMMDCGGAHNILDPMLYYRPWQGIPNWGNNVTGWHNATWTYYFNKLDTETDPAAFAYYLDDMQLIMAREVPTIPCFINTFLYAFSDYYWDGWVTYDNDYQQLLTTSTNDQFVMKQRMILNLISTNQGSTDITPPTWIEEPTDQTIEYGETYICDVDAIDDSGTVYYIINDSANFQIGFLSGIIISNTILESGTYNLNITAYDPSGNYCDSIIAITVGTDTIPGYDLVILIACMFTSIIAIGIYKKKKLHQK